MPALANRRHEALAQALFRGLADGITQGEAYSQAGYTSHKPAAEVNACRLLKMAPEITARVKELQEQAAKKKRVTVEAMLDELDEARIIAMNNGQPSAMVSATLGKAKIAGLDVNRSEVGKPGDFTSVTNMNELADKLLRVAGAHPDKITNGMREMAIAEMQRHSDAIAAIAHADESQQKH
jgi:hypothetical protein